MATPVKPATKSVTLYVGGDLDLLDEYEQLRAAAAAPRTMAGSGAAERLAEVEAEIRAGTMRFRFQALGRRALQKLVDAHPPRADKPNDQVLGFNEDTATDALVRRCLVDPALSDKALDELLEAQLSDGDYQTLSDTVWRLNRRSAALPLSLTGSTPPRSTAAG